jgi:ribosomal protein S18 acetylase RimI-like enzyme
MNTITIKLSADRADWKTCAVLMAASDPWLTLGMNAELCEKAFVGDEKEIYIAKLNDQINGFVILQMKGSFKGYIQTLFVKDEWRGKGIGKQLLQFSEQRILKVSPNIFICVSSFNTAAAKLYYEFGFELVGELKDFVKKGFTELLLRKTVGPMVGYQSERQ